MLGTRFHVVYFQRDVGSLRLEEYGRGAVPLASRLAGVASRRWVVPATGRVPPARINYMIRAAVAVVPRHGACHERVVAGNQPILISAKGHGVPARSCFDRDGRLYSHVVES